MEPTSKDSDPKSLQAKNELLIQSLCSQINELKENNRLLVSQLNSTNLPTPEPISEKLGYTQNPGVSPLPIQEGVYFVHCFSNQNMVWDIYGGEKKNSSKLIIYPKHGGLNQQFYFKYDPKGFYYIYSVHSRKAIDVRGGSTKDSTKIIQYDFHGKNNQQWQIIYNQNHSYTFINMGSRKVADVRGGKFTKSSEIISYHFHNGDNQKFTLELLSAGRPW